MSTSTPENGQATGRTPGEPVSPAPRPGELPHRSGPAGPGWRELNEVLAPFVAWLATQGLDDATRRQHRDAVERYLQWSHTDSGAATGRRRRYEDHLRVHDPGHLNAARDGLNRWSEHRQILAHTLPEF